MNPIGHQIIRLDETESSNTMILNNPAYLENHGMVLVADHQTAGRGRVGRKWVSLPGKQLQFSVVIHPTLPREQVPLMSLMAGVVVAEVLESNLSLKPKLKWPNDVQLGDKKVCGILIELKTLKRKEPWLVVGIGINCLGQSDAFPADVRGLLTTLEEHAEGEIDREILLSGILAGMEKWFQRLVAGESEALLDAWRERAELEGKRVRFPTSRGPEEGDVKGISEEGFLLVETAEGEGFALSSGIVEWL